MKILTSYKEFLTEMAYPIDWDFNFLKSLESFKKRLEYVNSKLTKISSGSARAVYYVDDEKVLKVAMNAKGLAQNKAESDQFLNQYYSMITNTYNFDEEFRFLEMEYAKKLTVKRFKELVGISFKDFQLVIDFVDHTYDLPFKLGENEFLHEMIDYIVSHDLVSLKGDFKKMSSYGEVTREGIDMVVLVDFGLTKEVWDNHYK